MDYQLSAAYREQLDTRDALEKLCHDLTGDWPLQHETPQDIADRIRRAVKRERETAAREQTERLL